MIALFMMIVEEIVRNQNHDTNFPNLVYNVSASITASAKVHTWAKAIGILQAFVSAEIVPSISTLSKKECSTFWGNLRGYFQLQ